MQCNDTEERYWGILLPSYRVKRWEGFSYSSIPEYINTIIPVLFNIESVQLQHGMRYVLRRKEQKADIN